MRKLANDFYGACKLAQQSNIVCGVVLALVVALSAKEAQAVPVRPTISIWLITSGKQCNIYQESAGSSAIVMTRKSVAAAATWRTWLVKDCIDNFASIRTSLEAALASTGKFTVVPKGGVYALNGAISDVGEGGGTPNPTPYTNGFAIYSRKMFVNMDVKLQDAGGRTIYGGLLTKQIETESGTGAGSFETTSRRSGQALYGELQHQVALAVARLVSFRIEPLRVTSLEGRQVQLNYGSPLLTLGAIVQATSPDGGASVRYNVVSSTTNSAIAQVDGDGDVSRIVPGSVATVIEAEDPAANGRRFRKVDLP